MHYLRLLVILTCAGFACDFRFFFSRNLFIKKSYLFPHETRDGASVREMKLLAFISRIKNRLSCIFIFSMVKYCLRFSLRHFCCGFIPRRLNCVDGTHNTYCTTPHMPIWADRDFLWRTALSSHASVKWEIVVCIRATTSKNSNCDHEPASLSSRMCNLTPEFTICFYFHCQSHFIGLLESFFYKLCRFGKRMESLFPCVWILVYGSLAKSNMYTTRISHGPRYMPVPVLEIR